VHVPEPAALAGLGLLLMTIGFVARSRYCKRDRGPGALLVHSTHHARRPPGSEAAACRVGSDVRPEILNVPTRRESDAS
jgi:hypothetical protein